MGVRVIICVRCGERAEYPTRPGSPPLRCPPCRTAHAKEHQKALRQTPEFRERNRAQTTSWRLANPEKSVAASLKSRFSRPAEELLSLRALAQCQICGTTSPGERGFHIDHDHACCPERGRSCGQCIRGLLCSRCNTLVGRMENNLELTAAALNYIAENPRVDWSDHQAKVL